MKTRTAAVVSALILAALGGVSSATERPGPAKIMLGIEPVLIDASGLHPLAGATDSSRVELGNGGAFHQTVALEPDRSDVLVYKLAYTRLGEDRIKLTLERSRERSGKNETLPSSQVVISMLETWSTTLFDDSARQRRVVLRVLPELRTQVDDEPLNADRFVMRLYGGPLTQYGRSAADDRVIFRAVNMDGAGVEFGIPGFGVARLHLKPFPGATKVGWVRGTTMSFELGGQSFQAWSVREILPEDPERPGKGWVLYGALVPSSEARDQAGYYGGFQPGR
jgi:hypothetical protein